jgi:hypothetical protein
MKTASYLFPLALSNQRYRLSTSLSCVLMLLALCVFAVPMTLVFLADHLRMAR